jgi:nucleotide sugar dehydrogenase
MEEIMNYKNISIGVIGKGFVGSAVSHGFSPAVGFDAKIKIYDKDPAKSLNTLEEVITESEFIFISVPTPTDNNGKIDLSILIACFKDIENVINKSSLQLDPVFLIRSTIVPGTSRKISEQFPNLNIVFNPEFLTERSANFDFISQTRFILGGDLKNVDRVAELFNLRFGKSVTILKTDFESSELIKYVCNTYFATKVSFLNEMRLLSDKINANWEDVIEGFVRDGRVGHSHTNVPGPDGKFGFGGSCFPKDIQAIINFAEGVDVDLEVLKGAWQTNLNVRPEKDWENLVGRAISEKE